MKKYGIYIHKFSSNSGGIICLGYLCHLLNEIGEKAFMVTTNDKSLEYFDNDDSNLNLNMPILKKNEIDDETTIIYPEIVDNNPLGAKNVVRWLLHRPGFHTGRINFGKDDLIVAHTKTHQGTYEIDERHILNIKYIMDNIYYNKNLEKTKTCYSIRKGRKSKPNLKLVHQKDSICIDGKSHQEISDIFNKSHTFISYDTYSTFSLYAALCGTTSIVIPDENVSKKDWYHDVRDTYGIAYGLEDIEYANQTRDLLYQNINIQKQSNIDMVKNFVSLCEDYFK